MRKSGMTAPLPIVDPANAKKKSGTELASEIKKREQEYKKRADERKKYMEEMQKREDEIAKVMDEVSKRKEERQALAQAQEEMTEDEFMRRLPAAEMKVDILTHYRARDATGYKGEQVKACVANLINRSAKLEQDGAGDNVKSASNDGYSETYELVTPEQAEEALRKECFRWLSGTGLMGAM